MLHSSLRIALLACGLAVAALGPVGCDGGGNGALPTSSGVSRSKYFDQLSADEIRALCIWSSDVEGGPGDHTCGDAGSMHTPTVDECVAGSSTAPPHCQVALVEDCGNSLHGDACQVFVTPACKTYVECVLQPRD
jgi:hypothetical protein